ncbi:MAG: HIT domain-containing protein [Clostridia bacterium]
MKNDNVKDLKCVVDFLGNKLEFKCMGCAISSHEIIVPGGIIYEDNTFIIHQDPMVPIKGFIVITVKKHIKSITELNNENQIKLIEFVNKIILYLKDLNITEEVTIIQEERSNHLHFWIFPHHSWMDDQFGRGVSYFRDIFDFSKIHATKEDKEEVLDVIKKIKEKFKINL